MQTFDYKTQQKRAIRRLNRNDIIEKNTIFLMGITGILIIILEMSWHGILLGGLLITTAICVAFREQTHRVLTNFEKLQRFLGINLYPVLFALVSFFWALDFGESPADAQFFNNAQTWMTSTFSSTGGGDTSTVVAVIFNVLRALFLLYVGISLVRVVQAARNDEDWQSLARTPLIIVMSVVVGDLITGIIVKT